MSEQTHSQRKAGKAGGPLVSSGLGRKVNWPGSIIANRGRWPLQQLDFRPKKRGATVVHMLLLDTSGSVLAGDGFSLAKGLILQLVGQAYIRREQVMIFGFGNQQTAILFGRRRAPKSIKVLLDSIPVSGGTPLTEVLEAALKYQSAQARSTTGLEFKTYLITDGRVSQYPRGLRLRGDVVVVDIEQSAVRRGRSKDIAQTLGADYFPLTA